MNSVLFLVGSVGVAAALAGLLIVAMSLARQGRWPMALVAIAGIATILFLLMVGIEYSDDFWRNHR